ncbi:MAG TPA: transcription elongation factor GreA [Thermomicrobiales bacterium]|nr:transcription elongation factor GreA [Thermomicrobiales bacterium]
MVQERVVQLTAGGKVRLDEELRLLRDERKPALATRIYEVSEHGDVTDNGEFEELKEELIMTEARIAVLEQMLTRAEIIETGRSDGTVRLGSRVRLSSDDGEEETWLLVSPEEANSMEGSISTESPVGRALIGCHEGESATVTTPAGSIVYTVLSVE